LRRTEFVAGGNGEEVRIYPHGTEMNSLGVIFKIANDANVI
jgi:hypothetical protein